MKLLFDQNISFRATKKLQSHFPGCLHLSDCNLSDCEDREIWEFAKKNECIIVTFDSDFYDISILNGQPPKIIWIRTGNLTSKEIVQLMIVNQNAIHSFIDDDDFIDISCLELE